MAEIICYADSCKYWQEGNHCSCAEIEISEDNECDSYVDYTGSEEWQTPFWKATYDGKISTGDHVNYNTYGKETGQYCGKRQSVTYFGGSEKTVEKAKNYPPVMSLPITTYNEESKELTFIEESEEEK